MRGRILAFFVAFLALSCSTSQEAPRESGREKSHSAAAVRQAHDGGVLSVSKGAAAEGTHTESGRTPSGPPPAEAEPRGPAPLPPRRGDPADDHIMTRIARATGARFTALDEGPYRVIVEGPPERAAAVVARTVRPVREALAKQHFKRGPVPLVRLVLFMHADTFRTGAEALSGERPHTPFGYYCSQLRAVIMNLATGGGTLVHEMVHTFVEEDFPGCPAWLNEGLGSLYEQCRIAPERLVGLTNWRLPALKDALAGSGPVTGVDPARVGVLARVVGTRASEFYGERSGLNYAVARYLCYDLQEQGFLERFYGEFRADVAKAKAAGHVPREVASGRRALERVLGQILGGYEPAWRARTMKLRFR